MKPRPSRRASQRPVVPLGRPAGRVLALPFVPSLLFASFVALPQIRDNPVLLKTFLVTAALLIGWAIALAVVSVKQRRVPTLAVSLLKQHYLQACAHLSILLYWGWYWRPVYDHAYLILAQLVFAYAFDMLLQLSRHRKYTLGFGPFPIVFSINLFLWFRNEWFYYQFVIVSVGFLAKEFLRWNKGGKLVHIFNPSSFPLAIACWVLLPAHAFGMTFGDLIASTQFFPPNIYPFIFLVSLPGQFLFGVTTMTFPAVLTMYLWAQAYYAITGVYFQFTAYIAIAVFLAMHLLITDPSTSPRSELGRILYGVAYAGTVIVLELTVQPGFTAKLMLVPALNLLVRAIDRAAQSKALRRFDPARIAPRVTGRRRNLATMAIWAVLFGGMLSLHGLGDRGPGQDVPIWQTACIEHPERACPKLRSTLDHACRLPPGSGWACNQLAILRTEEVRAPMAFDLKHRLPTNEEIQSLTLRACQLRFQPGCANVGRLPGGGEAQDGPPTLADYRILLSLYKPPRRAELFAMKPQEVYADACRHGWTAACSPPTQ